MASVNLAIRLQFEPIRTIIYSSIGAGYMGVGTAILNPARQFFVENLTNATLMFSFDGVNDHFALPENGFFLSDIMSNRSNQGGFFLSEGTRLYVKEIGTPSSGSVYFTVMYASDI